MRLTASIVALAAAGLLGACGSGGPPAQPDSPDPEAAGGPGELQVSTAEWETDFSKSDVPLSEFLGGGPPKDGIPAIDDPKFVSVERADGFLADREPVGVVEVNGETRGYPIQILIWHEIVNDVIGGEPVAVTYCPLCNSTIAFSRTLDGETLDFGTTGLLRRSNLVMYDRQTESWWQQIGGDAVVGELTGAKLEILASQILSWEDFRRLHPGAEVLSRETGFRRDYGNNPYPAYDRNAGEQPFALGERADETLPPKARVVAVQPEPQRAVVYPLDRLESEAPLNDEIAGDPVVVLFDPDVASALDDQSIASGRSVGAGAVFGREVDGRTLEFEAGEAPGSFRDRETGSTWDIAGQAIAGELEGTQLEPVPSDNQFWFSVAAFFEDPDIRR